MKKILVFGGSGGTGKHFIEQALSAGYAITAVIRNPDAFTVAHQNLTVIKGDVLIPKTYEKELEECETVVSCLGIPKIQQTTLYSSGIRNIVSIMEKSRPKRLICISSGALDIPAHSSFIMTFLLKNVLQKLYKPIYADMRIMEGIIKASGLDWTIVRAPKLTDGKATGKYKNITGLPLRGIPKISRADLAAFMLTHIADSGTFKSTIDVANP
ncbi:Putative NADH-flavin reductase [Pedobacter steynii]|uniref:Putative NADH-flavin reductase n=1 Tax=Pedobacter steynii TaxID=430522 RepID=A0A1H0JQZ5_9SPHI|nr:SDR family oxidoreductase [Pedobacter steynii]NQX43140.1 SDR family oxidoreductase [Pedobacter steynii]SDO46168.1 Putative NADH-flavin reductase [Pedobacter steynii]